MDIIVMINKSIIWIFFFTCFCMQALTSCDKDSYRHKAPTSTKDTFAAAIVVKAKKFTINNLDTLQAPQVVQLSQKTASENIPAGFYANMQYFNTEQGLALSSLKCAYKDKAGNLWFGTSGNGVSRYDGKTFTNFNSNHGLIHNLVNCIIEDSKGTIWFGTYGGVSKYDGIRFENFTTEQGLLSNSVVKIKEDKKGNLWMATLEGVSKYTPPTASDTAAKKRFTNYTKKDGLMDGGIDDIVIDHLSSLWLCGDNGISKLSSDAIDNNQNSFEDFGSSFGLPEKSVRSLCVDKKGNIWAGTDGIISRYTPAKNNVVESYQLFTAMDGLVDTMYFDSFCDSAGNLWFGSKDGVLKYNEEDNTFMNFTLAHGLTDNEVRGITEDNTGSIWFATLGGGLCRYDGQSVISYNKNQGLQGKAVYASVLDNKDDLWIAPSDVGIVKFGISEPQNKEKTFTTFTSDQGLLSDEYYGAVADSADNIWFCSSEGISKINATTIVNFTNQQGLPSGSINSLSKDKAGNIWLSTFDGGVSKFDGKSFTNFSTNEGLVHKTVWSIIEDSDGIIWIATRGGLSRYDPQTSDPSAPNGYFMNFKKEQGLPDDKLSTVMQDQYGNIIIGSWGGGLSVIKKDRAKKLSPSNTEYINEPIFENFSSSNGLPNDVVYSIVEDRHGNLIVGTSEGLTVFKNGIKDGFDNIKRKDLEIFNAKTGYPIKDISNNNSMLIDAAGVIWAGTGDKLVRFDYSKVLRNSKVPTVLIQSVAINNEPISWRSLNASRRKKESKSSYPNAITAASLDELNSFERNLTATEIDSVFKNSKSIHFDSVSPFQSIPFHLSLPYAKNDVNFDFVAIITTRPALVRYKYMLEGNDTKWSTATNKTTATFGNIKEGSYTFLVKAQNDTSPWSEPVAFQFTIRPPLHRTLAAYLLYGSLLLWLVYAVDKYQRKRLLRKERNRNLQKELEQAKKIETAYTELKSTQAQLIHSEKMASLGELTAGVAHEIQNPLNFVTNFSEVSVDLLKEMREKIYKDNIDGAKGMVTDIIHNLEKINHHGKRADAIVKGMLQHSRSSSGIKELTDLNALCDEYVRLSYHGLRAKDRSFNAKIQLDFDKSIGKINIIPQDFGRVILNLLNNAFYAVNQRRVLTKSSKTSDYQPLVSIATRKDANKIVITVSDNGNGIPEAIRSKIFQPFFTTKPPGKGTGLGLSMSYDIITKVHNGQLEVQSIENEGTTFSITLKN